MGSGGSKENNKDGDDKVKIKTHNDMSQKDRAVLDLKIARDRLVKFQKKNENENVKLVAQIKELLKNGKKDKAAMVLRMKKYKDKEASNIDNQLLNLQALVSDIEFAQHQVEVVQGLKAGNEALKKLNEMMPIEQVQAIMDETAESIQYQDEINQILSQGLSSTDDEECLEELKALEQESNPNSTKATTKGEISLNELPEAPKHSIPTKIPAKSEEKVEEKEAMLA